MHEERIIRDEATYFTNRYLNHSTDARAIEQFKILRERLKDFYTPEYKVVFLDQIESILNKNLVEHKNDKHDGKLDPNCLYDNYIEKLLFYINQELAILPVLARQKHLTNSNKIRDRVFVSYSPSDKMFLEEIKKHFKPFEGQISFWDNSEILPGQNWREEVKLAISNTKVIILLLSADFLASDSIISDELPSLLKAAGNDGAVVLILILKPCLFEVIDELNQYQTMNPSNMPVLKMDVIQREELYVNLVRQTQRILRLK